MNRSSFFQNEEIFVQLDELNKFDKINQDIITASHKHGKHSSVMVKVSDCKASGLCSLPSQVSKLVVIFPVQLV